VVLSHRLLPFVQAGYTPLHFACYEGRQEMATLLVDRGANINAVDKVLILAQHSIFAILLILLSSIIIL